MPIAHRLRPLSWSIIVLGLVAGAAYSGYAVTPSGVETARATTPTSLCSGAAGPLGVTVEPERIVRKGNQESLILRLKTQSRFKSKARYRHVVEVMDDTNHPIAGPIESARGELQPSGATDISLPEIEAFPDGYYQAKVTIAAVSETDPSEKTAEVVFYYWRVQDAKIALIDQDQWLTDSRANFASSRTEFVPTDDIPPPPTTRNKETSR